MKENNECPPKIRFDELPVGAVFKLEYDVGNISKEECLFRKVKKYQIVVVFGSSAHIMSNNATCLNDGSGLAVSESSTALVVKDPLKRGKIEH